jgi:rare lipoprotein A (peptidoglycan hydrolase)
MRAPQATAVFFALAACLSACTAPHFAGEEIAVPLRRAPVIDVHSVILPEIPRVTEIGIASWYRPKCRRPTASGELYDVAKLTAAHRTLRFGTRVRVTNLRNGRSAVVRINDRGPYLPSRIIDLSSKAALVLGMRRDGLAPVRLEVIGSDQLADRIATVAPPPSMR